ALLAVLVGVANQFLSRSEIFSQVASSLPGLGLAGILLVLLAGITVGLVGSFLAVRRFSVE
ncbi:MAG: hypothetical protein RL417_488, partial [Pseudomonadota bacterium]